jgi:uncharacterized membrane-anchored protein
MLMKFARALLLLAAGLVGGRLSSADPATPDPTARLADLRRLANSVHYEKGTIALRGGLARVALPVGYRYLNPSDCAAVLEKIWGNPKQGETLGMIVPEDFDPLSRGAWAVVITFAEDGYVKDDDASKINYADLIEKMKEGTREASKARVKAGYPPIELVGWATLPRYDAGAHKLYWAKEIKFANQTQNTLNYNIRILGRRGVLVLNAIAEMSQLKRVEDATPVLLSMVDFQEGHRYADFKQGTDKVATYGIAALVAGGIAAKAGLLKGLWVAILASKKLIIVAVLALAAYFKRIWHWIRGTVPSTETGGASAPPPNPPA